MIIFFEIGHLRKKEMFTFYVICFACSTLKKKKCTVCDVTKGTPTWLTPKLVAAPQSGPALFSSPLKHVEGLKKTNKKKPL